MSWNAPILKCDLACIVSDNADLELISKISCFLNDESVYYPMFRMPELTHKYNTNSTTQDDDYWDNLIGHIKSTHINNAMAKTNAHTIILVGIDDIQLSYFHLDDYFNVNKIRIDNMEDVDNKLSFLINKYSATLSLDLSDIAFSLYTTKMKLHQGKDSTSDKKRYYQSKTNGIIIAERNDDISDIIIANYAVSVKATLKFIDPVTREQVNKFYKDLLSWKVNKSYGGYLSNREFINSKIGDIDLSEYLYVTFFTAGIPYGVYFNEITCCTHVIIPLDEDLFIFNNILYECFGNRYDSALIFSPEPKDLGNLASSEAHCIEDILDKNSFVVKKLYKKLATVKAFDQYVGYYPYDILHVVSHGGEITGYCVEMEFKDRLGANHKIKFEEVVGFASDDTDLVQVASKRMPISFDGLKWMSAELKEKKYPDFIYTDMFKAISNVDDENVKRVKVDYLIEDSCHVQCYDGIHQGQFSSIASNGNPFIYNNSCTSWKEFSPQIIASGCRAYIGTLWSVSNSVAIQSAQLFYNKVFNSTIASTLREVLENIHDENYKDIYIFCGLHFSTIAKPSAKSGSKVLEELKNSLIRWNIYVTKATQKLLISNAVNIIKFYCSELSLFYKDTAAVNLIAKSLKFLNVVERINGGRED